MTPGSACRDTFAARFGEDQAAVVEQAAQTAYFDENAAMRALGFTGPHVVDDYGSDSFRYWFLFAIARGLLTDPTSRAKFGITADVEAMKAWGRSDGDLAAHDGNLPSYVAWLAGRYTPWLADGRTLDPCARSPMRR